jgi:hypothetical protein
MQIIDAMCLIDRVARVKTLVETSLPPGSRQTFSFGFSDNSLKAVDLDVDELRTAIEGLGHGITPTDLLSLALEGVLNFFYPADADERFEENVLKYYRQREWRIAGNVGRMGVDMMGLPSPKLIDRLMEIDAEFWSKPFPKPETTLTNPSIKGPAPTQRMVDWIYVFQGIDDRHIIGAVRRVIVPRDALETAHRIVAKHATPPPVIAIEDLALDAPRQLLDDGGGIALGRSDRS